MKLPVMSDPKSVGSEVGRNPLILDVKLRSSIREEEDQEALLLEDRRQSTIVSIPVSVAGVNEEADPGNELLRTQKGHSLWHILIIVTEAKGEADPEVKHQKVHLRHFGPETVVTKVLRKLKAL